MKRLLYLAILSMMAMTIWAPAALAQQGGDLCPGAVTVTSLSGSAADGEVESEPFDIETDLFQVAVDNTSVAPEGEEGFTSVEVARPGFTGFESMDFGDGEDGIFNVSNTGDGPFVVRASSDLQSYDITVYECPQGPGPGGDGNGEGTTPEGTTPEEPPEGPTPEEPPEGTTPNDNGEVQYEQPPEEPTTVVPPEEPPNGEVPPEQPPGDVPPGGGNGGAGTGAGAGGEEGTGTIETPDTPEGGDLSEGSDSTGGGAAEGDDPDEGGVVPILPDTGGASLLALGAGALLVVGGLLARRILR